MHLIDAEPECLDVNLNQARDVVEPDPVEECALVRKRVHCRLSRDNCQDLLMDKGTASIFLVLPDVSMRTAGNAVVPPELGAALSTALAGDSALYVFGCYRASWG